MLILIFSLAIKDVGRPGHGFRETIQILKLKQKLDHSQILKAKSVLTITSTLLLLSIYEKSYLAHNLMQIVGIFLISYSLNIIITILRKIHLSCEKWLLIQKQVAHSLLLH